MLVASGITIMWLEVSLRCCISPLSSRAVIALQAEGPGPGTKNAAKIKLLGGWMKESTRGG
eukprot:8331033-Pyramimonas_sp.AAC.1